jgi:hypothetical protein
MIFDNSLKRMPERHKSINKDFDLKERLLSEQKINQEFLIKLKNLTIEDLIYLKLDSAAESLNGKLYNFPIYKFISEISKEACVNYALSATASKKRASMVLGITKTELNRLIKLYNIDVNNKKQ